MILYDVIDYIQECCDNDEDFETDIKVLEAYKYGHTLKNTEIHAQIIDHSEYSRFTTFEDGKIYISPLQFNVYGTQMKIGGEMVSAQKAAYIIANKVIGWLNTIKLKENLPDVISAKNGTYASSRPLSDVGTVMYCSVVRIDLYLESN